ncbi:MAG: right-handed parallel beta-helix repeat-containing protein [Bacteroidales bacterium]|nr:right-handed parallel beta-helix repeat-containing protein [Candidatus Liminaster caballi]
MAALGGGETKLSERATEQTTFGTVFTKETILSGSVQKNAEAKYTWNSNREHYNTVYAKNSYHVVWFAMNGWNDIVGEEGKHAAALNGEALLDGCVIEDGYAYDKILTGRNHIAYGAGAYMVEGAKITNCEFRRCEASRDGGAIYMDGGGVVENCYIHDCQALGLGITYGYGGGVAAFGKGIVNNSAIVRCVGRMGGGMAFIYNPQVSANKYQLASSATVIANNTASTEGGGLYLNGAGLVNGLTIVRNKCNGTGVSLGGMLTGQSAGIYVRDHARIYNCVLWGGQCDQNRDVQFAASRSANDESLKPRVSYVSISNSDYADWSGTVKVSVQKLSEYNDVDAASGKHVSSLEGFPLFSNPTSMAGREVSGNTLVADDYNSSDYCYWRTLAGSAIANKGIQLKDLNIDNAFDVALLVTDIEGSEYSPRCALGAYTSAALQFKTDITEFFVDPEYHGTNAENVGESWTTPATNIADLLAFIKANNINSSAVTIHVKQGTLTTTESKAGRVRTMPLELISNVTIKGGYPSSLKGKDTSTRNPIKYPTVLTGNVLKDQYDFNVAHLVEIDGVSDVTIDGVQIRYGNASNTALADPDTKYYNDRNGAGIYLRGNASNIQIKNTLVAGCTADQGAAVYAQDAAQASFENCIFHNNSSSLFVANRNWQSDNGGIIYAQGTADLTFNHCDILRNVGYGMEINSTSSAKIQLDNSIVYGSVRRPLEDTNADFNVGDGEGKYKTKDDYYKNCILLAVNGKTDAFTGDHNLFDVMMRPVLESIPLDGGYGLLYGFEEGNGRMYPRFVNPTKNAGISPHGDVTYYGRATSFEPANSNPMVNAAKVTDPHSEVTNAYGYVLSDNSWGTDMSTQVNRDYGGRPDIGAVENHDNLKSVDGELANTNGMYPYGTVFYVRDYRNDDGTIDYSLYEDGVYRDGYSWSSAINGNALYEGINGLQYAVDKASQIMVQNSVRREETGLEFYAGGKKSVTTTRTHYDFTPSENRPEIQVWVAQGEYTKSNGFEMRNHVKVLGGFPDIKRMGTFCNPGENERHPQLTSDVAMSAENQNLKLDYRKYETILQTKPENGFDNPYFYEEAVWNSDRLDGHTFIIGEASAQEMRIRPGGFVTPEYGIGSIGRVVNFNYNNNVASAETWGGIADKKGNYYCMKFERVGDSGSQYKILLVNKDGSSVTPFLRNALTTDMFYSWTVGDGSAERGDNSGCAYVLNNSTDMPYGDVTVNFQKFADLSAYSKLVLVVSEGAPRFLLNRDVHEGKAPDNLIAIPDHLDQTGAYQTVVDNGNGTKTYTIDLAKIKKEKGFVRLHAIKGANSANVTVKDMFLLSDSQTGSSSYLQMQDGRLVYGDGNTNATWNVTRVDATGGYTIQNASTNDYIRIPSTIDQANYQDLVADGETVQYIYNIATKSYIAGANEWKTRASVSEYGYKFKVTDNQNGTYTLKDYVVTQSDWKSMFTPDANGVWVDNNDGANANNWVVTPTGNNTYQISNKGVPDGNLAAKQDPHLDSRLYLGNGATAAEWAFISEDDYNIDKVVRLFEKTINVGYSVLSQPQECRPTIHDHNNEPRSRVLYSGSEWDGFTIRNGYKVGVDVRGGNGGRRNGGSGVCLYENSILRNCVVRDNYAGDELMFDNNIDIKDNRRRCGRAAGIYCDGSSVINCYILHNMSNCSYDNENFGGGVYMIKGTLYNSVIAHNQIRVNQAKGLASGIFIESADFYNNTIVGNIGGPAIGVYGASKEEAHLTVYNTIVMAGKEQLINIESGSHVNFDHCFLQSEQECNSGKNDVLTNPDCTIANSKTHIAETADVANPFVKTYSDANTQYDYRIKANFTNQDLNCVNAGTENLGKDENGNPIVLPDDDMDYTDRIQDCVVDIGAYEYNGSQDIRPLFLDENNKYKADATGAVSATYFVSELGHGSSTAYNAENAACMQKLQKVLDAAGRLKYSNPDLQIIVKLAGNYDASKDDEFCKHSQSMDENYAFKYQACRTTDENDQNVRVWSIIVPRGVEVWGGYTDMFVSEDLNGFYRRDDNGIYSDAQTRDIVNHPTYFDSYYFNRKEDNDVYTYHVVTFTDKVFDEFGKAINGQLLSDDITPDRAVLDGIFITNGRADGEDFGDNNASVNQNRYGGAAIVTDYAHVRNCIIKNNSAIYGGALALTDNALVSGCLIKDNTANYGGGLYIIEPGKTLSNDTNRKIPDNGKALVYTSTIVRNTAEDQGGGVWFSSDIDNIRANSVVVWANESSDQANVSGLTTPSRTDEEIRNNKTVDLYPFAYSAVQNRRLSGASNLDVATLNLNGTRFSHEVFKPETKQYEFDDTHYANEDAKNDVYSDFLLYGLTSYSALVRTGMPRIEYDNLVRTLKLAPADFMTSHRSELPSGQTRNYIDIGARALHYDLLGEQLMLRLYVAKPENVDIEAAMVMMTQDQSVLYRQMGSSMAYPFQSLDDALEYINLARTDSHYKGIANNLPFEIILSQGSYYPTRDLNKRFGYSIANTFVIPEGVSVIGGFNSFGENPLSGGDNFFYAQYNKPRYDDALDFPDYVDIENNKVRISNVEELSFSSTDPYATNKVVKLHQTSTFDMSNNRVHADINGNELMEPWEFRYQSVLSGATTNVVEQGVYHVVTAIADENHVGQLPKDRQTCPTSFDPGRTFHEYGQFITIDGVHITGGYARKYVNGSLDDLSTNYYYDGAGIVVEGNRYANSGESFNPANCATAEYKNKDITNPVGYRDIQLKISNCRFNNNHAGYGGAISSNGQLHVFNSAFENNEATYTKDVDFELSTGTLKSGVESPGQGGAIFASSQLTAMNVLFANNEAIDPDAQSSAMFHHSVAVQASSDKTFNVVRGAGGAVYGGKQSNLHLINCDFVKNRAYAYPAVFTVSPNRSLISDTEWNKVKSTSNYNQIINCAFWQNEVNKNSKHTGFAPGLNINYAEANRTRETLLDQNSFLSYPSNQADLDTEGKYGEQTWFSAYEDGTDVTPVNKADLRLAVYLPTVYIPSLIKNYNNGTYQNCNNLLVARNDDPDGPNFGNPSLHAGADGYMESADWSPARLSILVDNGSGWLEQDAEPDIDRPVPASDDGSSDFSPVKVNFRTFASQSEAEMTGMPANNHMLRSDEKGGGVYYVTHFDDRYRNYTQIGELAYMHDDAFDPSDPEYNYLRIAKDPVIGRQYAYVDIGVYEYRHSQLNITPEGDELDVLWVSDTEKDGGIADGSSWEHPTTDLQRAIETLVSSRNGHRKEIRIMNGEYKPVNFVNGNLSFYIDTKYLNDQAYLPAKAYSDLAANKFNSADFYVKSLTIKGGYSKDIEGEYDVDDYPAVLRGEVRDNENSDAYNHLIYIKDATQRYGDLRYTLNSEGNKNGYESVYDEGSNFGACKSGDGHTVAVIPIQISGITVINPYAKPGTMGAAIYYADQDRNAQGTTSAALTQTISNDKKTTQTIDKDNPAKLILSQNKIVASGTHYKGHLADRSSSAVYIGENGGHSLLYNNVFHSNYGDPLVSPDPTIFINNTVALNMGKVILSRAGLPEVDGGHNGSGDGDQLAPQQRMDAPSVQSVIKNSILWRNNPTGNSQNPYGDQFDLNGYQSITASGAIFARNAFTLDGKTTTAATDYSDIALASLDEKTLAGLNFNVYLVDKNNDLVNGPNFVNPIPELVAEGNDAATSDELEKRDFRIKPSLRIVNRGDDAYYVQYRRTGTENKHDNIYDYNIYEYAWWPTTETDAASEQRFQSTHIDLGAYEYSGALNRVFYVDPNKPANQNGDGLSWGTAMSIGHLQDAIDNAGIYVVAERKEEAYVFIKGASATNRGLHLGEGITLRDGVSIYGGINPSRIKSCKVHHFDKQNNDIRRYLDSDIADYIRVVTNERSGVASPTGNKTTVSYIKNYSETGFAANTVTYAKDFWRDQNESNKTPLPLLALADGFDVTATTATNPTGAITEPVLNLHPKDKDRRIAVRNVIVHDNDASATSGLNVAHVEDALLYEALIRDNKTNGNTPVLNVAADGYVVNVTADGKTQGADGKQTYNGVGKTDHIFYSIVNYAGKPETEGTLSSAHYKVSDPNLNYQLEEMSQHIDELEAEMPAIPDYLQCFIDYANDRDLLGNPRLLNDVTGSSKLDRGAFETWKVATVPSASTEAVTTQRFMNGEPELFTSYDWAKDEHFYPHDGSVVYITPSNKLVLGKDDDAVNMPSFEFKPSYLLVQEGGSLYGENHNVFVSFVAVERTMHQKGDVISVPYVMDYASSDALKALPAGIENLGSAAPSYNDETGELILTKNADDLIYSYNGTMRADAFYTISDMYGSWNSLHAADGIIMPANQGVLYEAAAVTAPEASMSDITYRFTMQAETDYSSVPDGYIYVETHEDENPHKTVTLTQYNHLTDANGTITNGELTSKENMGWNCFGIPYLVSDYKPYLQSSANSYVATSAFQMHLPKELWLFYNGSAEAPTVANVAGFYPVNSTAADNAGWHVSSDAERALWVGEGMFAQTSTIYDTEALIFHLPHHDRSSYGAPAFRLTRTYIGDDFNDSDAAPAADNIIYDLQGRRVQHPGHGMYIINGKKVWL